MSMTSKILEAIISQVAFDMASQGADHSAKDYLALAILRREGSLARRIFERRLADWQLYQAMLRIAGAIHTATSQGVVVDEFFSSYLGQLSARFGEQTRLSTIHAMIDILSDKSTITSRVAALYGITAEIIETDTDKFTSGADDALDTQAINALPAATTAPAVDKGMDFITDLTALSRQGKIDPVVGREELTERVVRILSRRKKSNPILVGEAGVGKSAIAEALAARIVANNVPPSLAGKRLLSLDMARIVAGTKYRGEFEQRISDMIEQLSASGDAILFIDEIHTIVGAGSADGSLDAANILKPALARGAIRVIGATTLDEYKQCIEGDAALARRFDKVMVHPTTAEQSIKILTGIAPLYEAHHGVTFTAEALESCVTLTDRYISDRHLPDKAIDLMDEAGAEVAAAGRATVTADDIAHTLTLITGIPAERLSSKGRQRIAELESALRNRIIGQQSAVESTVAAIRRTMAGIREDNRPIAVLLFAGATGVGKTLLAKELSTWFTENSGSLIRLDMSEYSQPHTVSRLFGSAPGYVGYEKGGELTEAVRRRPYSVILFDEIEKAHTQIHNTLLQILDEGRLTDSQGRVTDFRNTIIILTSNIGAEAQVRRVGYATDSPTNGNDQRAKAIKRHFSAEFINRIDSIVMFNTLSSVDAQAIVSLEVETLCSRLEAMGYKVKVAQSVIEHIAANHFDSRYGARSLKRALQQQIADPIADIIIDGEAESIRRIDITLCNGQIQFTPRVALWATS